MATQYRCTRPGRLLAAREHATINGIDFLEVLDREAIALDSPRQRTLLVRAVKPFAATVAGGNVRIDGGVRVQGVRVLWAGRAADAAALHADGLVSVAERDHLLAQPDPALLLVVRTDREGDHSTYRLRLVEDDGGQGDAPLAGFDPLLADVAFSFKVECPSEFDCAPADACPPPVHTTPPIDYLAKDYASFRQLILDRLAVLLPGWRDRTPADVGIALVEAIAYLGDHLSYHQDAVATEAYLGTARRRTSVRRHARLLDYPMHDGSNARTWVAVEVEPGVQDAPLLREYVAGRRTRLLTRVPGRTSPTIAEDELDEVLAEHRPLVFELLHDARLFAAHNRIRLHTWGDEACCLPRGATRATLVDDVDAPLRLAVGDVLVLEEERSPRTAAHADADPAHRHAVRLTAVRASTDELLEQAVVEIEWAPEDALPFPLCLSATTELAGIEAVVEDVSVARGNVVLADHGRTIAAEDLDLPDGTRRYRPALRELDVTQRVPLDAAAWAGGEVALPAARALRQDPRAALADVTLRSVEHVDWTPARDLLASDRFEAEFVVETEEDGRAALRFGDDVYGRTPEEGVALSATYRVGSGAAGNVGADTIAHVVTTPGLGVARVRNPLAAVGGTAPESLDAVRLYAPQAFRYQERAVTEADYAAVAERHPEVSRAVARRRWTGSWHTVFVTVDRAAGLPVDAAFERELVRWIDRFELAGHDVEIEPPRFVPLDIALTVCVEAGHLRSEVQRALLARFGRHDLPDGTPGFFHPDRLTFGEPVYLSRIVAAAMEVPGVRWVSVDPAGDPPGRFQRWGERAHGEIAQGFIDIRELEIARLDNDPNAPESGRIEFLMEGGL